MSQRQSNGYLQTDICTGCSKTTALDAETAAVERIAALVAAKCSPSNFCDAVNCGDFDDENARPVTAFGNSPLHILKLFTAGLDKLGPRRFLAQTANLLSSERPEAGPNTARKRVAVYGGAFDPITNSHLTCAAEVVHSKCADEVWLVPCGPRPDKPSLKTPPIDRYCMCQLACNTVFAGKFPVKVSDIECFSGEAFFTYDLLCTLRDRHPNIDFRFIIGSDWLQLGDWNLTGSSLAGWPSKNWSWKLGDPEEERLIVTGHKMLAEFDFVVIRRPGYDVPTTPEDPTGLKQFGPRLSWLVMPEGLTFIEGNLSSTEVRKRTAYAARARDAAAAGAPQSIEGLVPPAVVTFMAKHKLYDIGSPRASKLVSSHSSLARKKRVAIYGGAFDPITCSHTTCAAQIVHSKSADEVWLVPCGPRPDKPNLKTPPIARYTMCVTAVTTVFSSTFPVKTVDIECFSEKAFATYDLLCSLRAMHPNVDFCFIIGSDWLQPGSNMAEWTSDNTDWKEGDPEDLKTIVTGYNMLQEFDFLVIKRTGYDVPATADDPTGLKQFGPRLSWLHMPEGTTFIEGNLSSTEVRKRAAVSSRVRKMASTNHWLGIDGLVPRAVLAYIRREGLYSMSWH